jgi:hypothetical protein
MNWKDVIGSGRGLISRTTPSVKWEHSVKTMKKSVIIADLRAEI